MTIRDCTYQHPIGHNFGIGGPDIVATKVVHTDVEEIEDFDTIGVLYKCNSCGLEFIADNTR